MKHTLASFFILLLTTTALAQQSQPAADPWKAQIDRADEMRRQAQQMRDSAQAQRDIDDDACYRKFLVNHCLNQSRERYLEKINAARQQEVDASNLEREAKTAELAIRDAERANNPVPTAGPMDPNASAPHAGPKPTMPPLRANLPAGPNPPKPTAPPIDPEQQAAHDEAKRTERARQEEEAARRAEQAREDKARYDARAAAAAERKAKEQSAPAAK